jgi:cysteine synthase
MAGVEQGGGQPQEQVNRTSRELLRGAITTGIGLAIGVPSFLDYHNTLMKQKEQSERAAKEVESQGIPRPDQTVVTNAQNLREELRNDPLADRNPDQIRLARQALQQQEHFNKVRDQREREIRDKEGYSDTRLSFDAAGGLVGTGGTFFGAKRMLETVVRVAVGAAVAANVENKKRKSLLP